MEYLRTITIAVIIIILTINMMIFQLIIFVSTTLIQPAFYDNILVSMHFYGQVRQFAFKELKDNLRFGEIGLPYLEKALTQEFLREEISEIAVELNSYFRGDRDDLPIIPIHRLKERVQSTLDSDRTEEEKHKIVQYWFDPLPDEVRFSDFTSTKPLWFVRYLVQNISSLLLFSTLLIILLIAMLMLTPMSIGQGLLWSSTSITSSAGIMIGLGLFLAWLIGYSALSTDIIRSIGDHGFPVSSTEAILKSLGRALSLRLNITAVVFLTVGGLMMVFAPVQES